MTVGELRTLLKYLDQEKQIYISFATDDGWDHLEGINSVVEEEWYIQVNGESITPLLDM